MRYGTSYCLLVLLHILSFISSQDLQSLVPVVGNTFCTFMATKNLIHRKNFGACSKPTCSWDSWSHATNGSKFSEVDFESSSSQRVVISYGHNGFGNMLWQHTVAFMVAESLKAKLYIAMIPEKLCFDGAYPPHTWEGQNAMNYLLPDEFEYHLLPENSTVRKLCEPEDFVVKDRPRDWRNGTYTKMIRQELHNIINDKKPRCIKMLGYFQNLPLCKDDSIRLWTTRMLAHSNMSPGPNDVSVYLRCLPRHYHFSGREYYQTILDNIKFEKVWLFTAPECPTKLGPDPSKDNIVQQVVRLLYDKYNASRWPSLGGGRSEDATTKQLLHDLSGLVQSKKLILPVSSWAFWGGFLSNASEIHVNAPPHHQLMTGHPQYFYHDEGKRKYFGHQSTKYEFDIDYDLDLAVRPPSPAPSLEKISISPSPQEVVLNTSSADFLNNITDVNQLLPSNVSKVESEEDVTRYLEE